MTKDQEHAVAEALNSHGAAGDQAHADRGQSVREVFNSYPPKLRDRLLQLRELVFETAHKTQGVGALVETLKWGQPAYTPAEARIGTTTRIDALKTAEPAYTLFCHGQTPLIAAFRDLYADRLVFQGNPGPSFSR